MRDGIADVPGQRLGGVEKPRVRAGFRPEQCDRGRLYRGARRWAWQALQLGPLWQDVDAEHG